LVFPSCSAPVIALLRPIYPPVTVLFSLTLTCPRKPLNRNILLTPFPGKIRRRLNRTKQGVFGQEPRPHDRRGQPMNVLGANGAPRGWLRTPCVRV
jgi:hypothetical protein